MSSPLHDNNNIFQDVLGGIMTVVDAASTAFSKLSDKKPNLMSKKALDNVNGHYPAGGS
jgi:hypothetical protein